MPAPDKNSWAEWKEAMKERTEAVRVELREWWEAARTEPEIIWQTNAVRYTTYAVCGLVAILLFRTLAGALEPGNASRMNPSAKTAYFDVLCENSECRQHFLIERKFRFHKFPVPCRFCGERTGQRALRCVSETCRGRLMMAVEEDGALTCIGCGTRR